MVAQAAGLYCGEASGAPELLHPHTRYVPDGFREGELIAKRDLLGVDYVERLGDLLQRQWSARRRHDDLHLGAGDLHLQVNSLCSLDPDRLLTAQRGVLRARLDQVLAVRHSLNRIGAIAAADRFTQLAAVAGEEPDAGIGDRQTVGVEHVTCDAAGQQRDWRQHGCQQAGEKRGSGASEMESGFHGCPFVRG